MKNVRPVILPVLILIGVGLVVFSQRIGHKDETSVQGRIEREQMKSFLEGKTQTEVICLLGKPDSTSETTWTYEIPTNPTWITHDKNVSDDQITVWFEGANVVRVTFRTEKCL